MLLLALLLTRGWLASAAQSLLRTVPKAMALSPSGHYIAMFCEDGSLMVLSSELEEIVMPPAKVGEELALQLAWLEDVRGCGGGKC